ncbi:hydrogenase/urease accessory protein HupE [Bradyrhizobium japonicum]|jgi:hydrogenase/urease accessory protein HupE|uniref:Hydrogenase/urease accessory protein HupE n=1 Tax=Bradyrhizobium elkanii TaxID=29448 RepID=A0A4Q4JTV8_BRAEL|nr:MULTISPECIES: HupE/UreJ family protein [Bradyrhizobium]MBP1295173.1 hydrogenase/urease accessory protein HupE [Bradyrhizobium elkanii]MBP2433288.1 hydrogenase/urease accessory protein HupE [Bradyrhizobium elkanii]MCP1733391.1 hydrogenase/urease accessory protein HupE [Bradyrhizobium elkanii]MCP1751059.1 hydrogenase/urease accessory protein HupE [Bradyrhizobium elkanii]MCP1933927.1 hydrogenase/urease accessory protein HupE [Bradyrhizobium elkanii]
MMRLVCAIAILLGWMCLSGSAHELRPAYLEIRQSGNDVFDILWKVPALGDQLRLALDVELPDDTVVVTEPRSTFANNSFVTRWQVSHPGLLAGKTIAISGLQSTLTDALVRIEWSGGGSQVVRLTPARPAFQLEPRQTALTIAMTYVGMGIEHILTGYDHLLFLFGIMMIVPGLRRLIGTITAFTVAHSITLALASLGVVNLPRPPIEAMIALSIMIVATEVVKMSRGEIGITVRYPWAVVFPFGLLHGLGFAGALLDTGLPQQDVPLALFAFNVGVECGQLIFIAALLGGAHIVQRIPHGEPILLRARQVVTYGIGMIAGFWLIERSLSFIAA